MYISVHVYSGVDSGRGQVAACAARDHDRDGGARLRKDARDAACPQAGVRKSVGLFSNFLGLFCRSLS